MYMCGQVFKLREVVFQIRRQAPNSSFARPRSSKATRAVKMSPASALDSRTISSRVFGASRIFHTSFSTPSSLGASSRAASPLGAIFRASNICNGSVTNIAPSRMKRCGPKACGSPIRWGTQRSSLLYSLASRAVIKVPDFSPASMTRTASAMPTMRRLRSGKKCTREAIVWSPAASLTTSYEQHGYFPLENIYYGRPGDVADMRQALRLYLGHRNNEAAAAQYITWESIADRHKA